MAVFDVRPTLAWTFDTRNGGTGNAHVTSTMTEHNNRLYVAADYEAIGSNTYKGSIFSLNMSGTKQWTGTGSVDNAATNGGINAGYIDSSVTIYTSGGTDTLYAGTYNSLMLGLNADGTNKWLPQAATTGAMIGSPVYTTDSGGTAVMVEPSIFGHLEAHKISNGNLDWKYPNTADQKTRILGSPAVSTGGSVIYYANAGDYQTTVYAINNDGTRKWEYGVDQGIGAPDDNTFAPPVVSASTGDIYVATTQGQIIGLNPSTGSTLFVKNLHGTGQDSAYGVVGGMALDDGNNTLYFAGQHGLSGVVPTYSLYQLTGINTGSPTLHVFSSAMGTGTENAPEAGVALTQHGDVLVGTGRSMEGLGHLYGYNSANLSQAPWTLGFPAGIVSSPIIAQGMLFVGCDNGIVYAYNPTGTNPTPSPTNTYSPTPTASPPTLSASTTDSNTDWPMLGHDGGHTNFAASETTITKGTDPLVTAVATPVPPGGGAPTPAPFESSPSIVGNVAYIGSDDNTIYAMPRNGGAPTWAHRPSDSASGDKMYASPVVNGGIVFEPSSNGKLYAVQASNGTALGQVTVASVPPIGYASPTFLSGGVNGSNKLFVAVGYTYAEYTYVATNPPYFSKQWGVTLDAIVWCSPIVDSSGNSYIATANPDGSFYAFNSTGGLIWRHRISFDPYEGADAGGAGLSADLANSLLFGGSNKHTFYAISTSTGGLIWSYQLSEGTNFNSVPSFANNLVFDGADNGLYAFNESSGALAAGSWPFKPDNTSEGFTAGAALIHDTTVCSCYLAVAATTSSNGRIYVIQVTGTGAPAIIREYMPNHSYLGSPGVSNGYVYIGASDIAQFYTMCGAATC